jgi:predicted DNA-binding protein
MAKSQIAVRIPPSLLEELNSYVKRTHASKTEIVIGVLVRYLDCAEDLPLSQRVAELEAKVAQLQALVKPRAS